MEMKIAIDKVIIGIGLSVIILLIYYNYTKTTNLKFKKVFPYILLVLAVSAPILGSLAYSKLTLTEKQVADNLGADFIKKAQEQLAKDNPEKIYIPDKNAELKKDEFTKQGAIDSLTSLLNKVKKGESKDEVLARFHALDKKEKTVKDVVDEDVINRLYLPDVLNNDSMVTNTILALMSITSLADKEDVKINGVVNLDEVIFDESTKTAHIPLDIYIGRFTGLQFEMVYNNNSWKLQPYTLMRAFQLSDFLSQQNDLNKKKGDTPTNDNK